MKKLIKIFLVVLVSLISLVGCNKSNGESDLEIVRKNKVLKVGMLEFMPMDYRENNQWVGFDADMAKAFASYLGVDVEFVLIDWDYKKMELNTNNIDCVWNGMSITNEIVQSMDVSNAYMKNSQVVVVKKDIADNYKDVDSIKNLKFVVEAGSSGELAAKQFELNYIAVPQQSDALLEVSSGVSEACIVDLLMAKVLTNSGASYDNLVYPVSLIDEEYAVGFRKGSDLVDEINKFFIESYKKGEMTAIAKKYGIDELLLEQK